ncbi:MFS transporter [Aquibacillus sediminis]|uniref:MFS transporter n=1 Tax=Aquibacillus sediminis TaxID=2574734 RepID=UPI0014875F66|nr:MFS transporter [Aquibacillus sediminis]
MTKSSWGILWVAFSAGVIATLVQFSVPPVMPVLQAQFDVTYMNSALLMSLFALMTLLAAVPGGFIVQKYGERAVGLLGIAVLFAGVLCSFFAGNFLILLLSRIIQGIGFGIVSVAAPSAIGRFIPPDRMSIAMGIWSTWIPLGSLIMFLFAPYIVSEFNTGIYWSILMLFLIGSFIIYAKKIPREADSHNESSEGTIPKNAIKEEVKNKRIWVVAGAFASFTFSLFAFNTWISTYLVESSSMSLAHAAIIPGLLSFFMIGSNLYGGFLLKRFENKLFLFLIPPLVMALIWPMFLIDHPIILYGSAIVLGVIGGITPTIIFASAPKLAKRKETIGIAMAIVIIGENTGILIGPEVFGILRDYTGNFHASFWILFYVGLITIIASVTMWRSWKVRSTEYQIHENKLVMEETQH